MLAMMAAPVEETFAGRRLINKVNIGYQVIDRIRLIINPIFTPSKPSGRIHRAEKGV
jgi:hypothetical protein